MDLLSPPIDVMSSKMVSQLSIRNLHATVQTELG